MAPLTVLTVATDRRMRDERGRAARAAAAPSAAKRAVREQDLAGLAALRASCGAAGARLVVLGADAPFVGFADKIRRPLEHLEEELGAGRLAPDAPVVFADVRAAMREHAPVSSPSPRPPARPRPARSLIYALGIARRG